MKYQMTVHGLLPLFIIWPLASFPSTPSTFTDHGLGKRRNNIIKRGQNSEHHGENLEKNKIDDLII